ncbi:MAG: sulfatase, partial [Planctomycetes bacterium]|nr:sulfatase [Planctomycetota bacterium]
VHTPNIDRLAAGGTAFTNAHTAAPVCCPSRAAMMSGRLPSSTGVYGNSQWWKPHLPDLPTLPVHFRRHGYVAVGAGKLFHHTAGNNPPGQWDAYHRLTFNDDAWTRVSKRYKALYPFTKPQPVPAGFPFSGLTLYSPEVDWGALSKPEPDFDDSQTIDYGIRFLSKKHDRPFFLACGTFRPHLPWYTPQKYVDLYPLDQIKLPEAPPDDLDDVPEAGRRLALAKANDLEKVRDARKWKEAVRMYLASISFADAQVGRLLDALDRSPARENTIVVLWSDHGWHLGEKGHWHKRTLWEEATRVPLVVVAPGHGRPGQRSSRAVSLIDVFPTLNELCGLRDPPGLDGKSLVPLVDDPTARRDQPAVIVDQNRHCAVRDDRYRYIRYADGSEELYDHATDPNEWTNLAHEPSLAEVKSRLAQWIPRRWADPAPSKRAYRFDPHQYTWTVKKTGEVIEGGRCEIDD